MSKLVCAFIRRGQMLIMDLNINDVCNIKVISCMKEIFD